MPTSGFRPAAGRPRWGQAVLPILLMMLALSCPGCPGMENRETAIPPPPEPKSGTDEGTRRFEQFLDIAFSKVMAARDFHCLLLRTEMVGDSLKPQEELDFYDRFNPQSLRLEWVGERYKGRHLIYVAGENDNKILIRPEGMMGLIGKTLRFDLDSPIVRMYGRYPPDVAGYNNLLKKIVDIYGRARKLNLAGVKASPPVDDSGRKLQCFEVMVEASLLDIDVSKMVIWFDTGKLLPVHTVFYDAVGRMVEDYVWGDVQLDVGLTDDDFVFKDQR
jgi:hypothetical protein